MEEEFSGRMKTQVRIETDTSTVQKHATEGEVIRG